MLGSLSTYLLACKQGKKPKKRLGWENMKLNEPFLSNYLEGDEQSSLRGSLISVVRADFQDFCSTPWLGLSSRDCVSFPSFYLVITKWVLFRSETLDVCVSTPGWHPNAVCHCVSACMALAAVVVSQDLCRHTMKQPGKCPPLRRCPQMILILGIHTAIFL